MLHNKGANIIESDLTSQSPTHLNGTLCGRSETWIKSLNVLERGPDHEPKQNTAKHTVILGQTF